MKDIYLYETIDCPFCKETNFDLIGLKEHFEKYYCDVYHNLEDHKEYSDEIRLKNLNERGGV